MRVSVGDRRSVGRRPWVRGVLALGLLLIGLLLAPSAANAQTCATCTLYAITELNLRQGPSLDDPVLRFVPRGAPGTVAFFLQKPSADRIRELAATHAALADSGVWLLSERALEVLWRKTGGSSEGIDQRDWLPSAYELYYDDGKYKEAVLVYRHPAPEALQ